MPNPHDGADRNPAVNLKEKNDRISTSKLIHVGHWVEVAYGVGNPYIGKCVGTDEKCGKGLEAVTVEVDGKQTRVFRDQCRPVGKVKLSRNGIKP